jgi:hypothetical protein
MKGPTLQGLYLVERSKTEKSLNGMKQLGHWVGIHLGVLVDGDGADDRLLVGLGAGSKIGISVSAIFNDGKVLGAELVETVSWNTGSDYCLVQMLMVTVSMMDHC